MMALPSVMNDWVIEDLPDLLWMDCLVHLHRDRGARLFREFQQLVRTAVGDQDDGVVVDGRLTSLEATPTDLRQRITADLAGSPLAELLLPDEVRGVFSLYPSHPAKWLIGSEGIDSGEFNDEDTERAMNFLAQAMFTVIGDRHANALVKTAPLGWLMLTQKLTMPPQMVELLRDYPTNSATRGAADAAILSSFLATKAMDDALDDGAGHRLIVSNNKNRFGTVYPYFICIGRQQRRTDCTQKAVRIDDVERLVEEHYATITPGRDLIEQLRNLLEEELANQRHLAEEERLIQKRRVGALKDERKKLLEAHYADAVPLELLKTEQARIAGELKAAEGRLRAVDVEFDQAEANLAEALAFAADWHSAYLEASPIVRRQLNRAIFKKIYVDDAAHVRSELAEPFETLLSDEITTAARERAEIIDQEWREAAEDWSAKAEGDLVGAGIQSRQGVSFETLVGLTGQNANHVDACL